MADRRDVDSGDGRGHGKAHARPVESAAALAVASGNAEVPAALEQGTLEAAPFLRKNFRLRHPIAQARAYICGLGYYEMYLNGVRVGDHVLDPAQTDYDKRAFYVTYDVTKMLTTGDNAIGVILGDGWFHQKLIWGGMSYGRPCLLLQLSVTYDNGERETLVSDRSWKCTQDGPVRGNNVYWGEDFDATKELPGWDRAAFDDSRWSPLGKSRRPPRGSRARCCRRFGKPGRSNRKPSLSLGPVCMSSTWDRTLPVGRGCTSKHAAE